MDNDNKKPTSEITQKSRKTAAQSAYSKITSYIGEWGAGQNKERLLGNIHRNLIGVDKMGVLRPPEDLAYFLLVCQQYGLNPLRKEIYAVYQRQNVAGQWIEKLEPIVSIHGLRTLARRSKNPTYAYTGKAVFEERDDGKITTATVEVYGRFSDKNDAVKVGEYTAYLEEFQKTKDGQPIRNWKVMPRVMLAKCAEANAIRMAFNIGGVYVEEEVINGQEA
jgi:phage recombination protein Bet